MKEFDSLLEVAERLLGPGGCPWDQKQTFFSLQPYVLEEAHEVIEAVDRGEDPQIIEELGDLLYTIVFYGKLAQMQGRFSMESIVTTVKEKLIRRHPHVFGELKVDHVDDVVKNWERIKKEEKGEQAPKSKLDGIPATLAALARAQKILKRIVNSKAPVAAELSAEKKEVSEEEAGEAMVQLIAQAEQSGVDIESALRRALSRYETRFRDWEQDLTT